jgi:hypothetical protein
MRTSVLSLFSVALLGLTTLPGCIFIVDPPSNNEAPSIDSATAELIYDGSTWVYQVDVTASDLDLDSLVLEVTVSQPSSSTAAVTWTFDPGTSWSRALELAPDFLPQWDAQFEFRVADGHGGTDSRTETLTTTVESPWVDTLDWGCGIDGDNVAYFFVEADFAIPQSALAAATALFLDASGDEELFTLSPDSGDDLLWFFEADAAATSLVSCSGVYDVEVMAADDRGVTSYTLFEDVTGS